MSCQDKVDLRVFVFSFTDTSSFTELPAYITSTSDKDINQVAASIVIGTRNSSKAVVSPTEIKNFKLSFGIEVVYSLPQAYHEKIAESLPEIIPLMNDICEILWLRDQHYIMNNSVTV
uniref:REM2-and Rab-like small GTPase 1 n=2 Tax=Lygus hesperus TaxID=30085 RepID=A0A146MAY0_LYGHE